MHVVQVERRPALVTREGPPATSDRRPRLIALAILTVPAVLLLATAVARYLNGRSSIDLLVFDQGLWAASRGHLPWSSVIQESLLEDHFGPGLLTFSILYRIVATPLWLFGAQAVAAAAAVWLVVKRLIPAIGHVRAGFLGAALLVSPPVAYALLFDFHTVVLAVPFGLAAIFALDEDRPRRALVLGLLAALFRVEVGLAVMIAFAVWPGRRRGRLAPGLLLAAYLLVAMYFEKALGHDVYWPLHFGHLGSSPVDALRHPVRLASELLSPGTLAKALPWLATGAFLALRRPRLVLPTAFIALPVLLSSWPGTSGIVYQYGFAPTLLLAAAWLPAVRERPQRAGMVIAGCVLLGFLLGPFSPGLPSSNGMQGFLGQYWTPKAGVACIGQGIPDDAVVAGTQPITLLAHRPSIYLWPYPFEGASEHLLPADYISRSDAGLAAAVDYLLVPRDDDTAIPPGFVIDGEAKDYLRYRRAATTTGNSAHCK